MRRYIARCAILVTAGLLLVSCGKDSSQDAVRQLSVVCFEMDLAEVGERPRGLHTSPTITPVATLLEPGIGQMNYSSRGFSYFLSIERNGILTAEASWEPEVKQETVTGHLKLQEGEILVLRLPKKGTPRFVFLFVVVGPLPEAKPSSGSLRFSD